MPVSSQPPAAPSPADPVSGSALSPLPEPPTRRVTIREVAALAGVSIGTASKALNGQGKLRAETRERVAQAARELGFAPNVLARGLLAGRTYTVGHDHDRQLRAVQHPGHARRRGRAGRGPDSVFMCDAGTTRIRERQYLDTLFSRQRGRLIVTGRRTSRGRSIGRPARPVVYAMTQSLDTRRVAILPGRPGGARWRTGTCWRAAGAGWATSPGPSGSWRPAGGPGGSRHGRRGGRLLPASDVLYGEWSERWGRKAARMLLAGHPGVDAMFCGSDQIARGVSDTLRQLGYRVPDDIALVGFDNWDPMVAGCQPPLTSIDMCLVDVGRTAAEHCCWRSAASPRRLAHVPCRLVARGSTATEPGEAGKRDGHGLPGHRRDFIRVGAHVIRLCREFWALARICDG